MVFDVMKNNILNHFAYWNHTSKPNGLGIYAKRRHPVYYVQLEMTT